MYTLGYSFRPWTRAPRPSPTAPRSSRYIRDDGGRDHGDRPAHPLPPHGRRGAAWSTRRRPLDGRRRAAPTRASGRSSPAASCSCAPATTATTSGYTPEFPGATRFAGQDRPPAALARGPRLRGQAGGGHRQRRHRRDPGAGAGRRRGRARDHAAALAHLRRRPPGRGPPSPTAAPRACRPAVAYGRDPLEERRSSTHGFYSSARRRPERGEAAADPAGVDAVSCPRATTSTPTSPPATTRGTSACAWCPTATSSRPSRRARASVVTDTIETFTETGIRLESGNELDGRHHRHGHRAASCSCWAAWPSTSTARPSSPARRVAYKGMMLCGVPNLAVAFGYTNASWTLKCDLTCEYVLPPAQPHAAPGRASARRSTATARVPRETCSASPRATCCAPPTGSQSRASATPGTSPRAICATTGRSSAAGSRTARWSSPIPQTTARGSELRPARIGEVL